MDKIKTLSIDLETFSDVDLAKCGVYRYVESPAFEILLFGVSVNGSDVVVYDLVQGEKIPAEILAALTDNSIIKWAFNAAFERVCLSMYLGLPSGEYLNPTSWRCSMVWSAYMGLPLSLAGAGAVLGLSEQKLKEGKDLIKYFCVPCAATKANGGRTRNLPNTLRRNGCSSRRTTSAISRLKCRYRTSCGSSLCRNLCGRNIVLISK